MKEWTLESAIREGNNVSFSKNLNCNVSIAFEAFTDAHIHNWFNDISSAKWLSNSKTVGGVRQVNLNTMNVREHFFTWEDDRRFTFYIKEATLPLLDKMIEDCQFEAIDDNNCKVTWDVYFEPKILSPLLSPVTKFIYKKMFGSAMKNLESYVLKMK